MIDNSKKMWLRLIRKKPTGMRTKEKINSDCDDYVMYRNGIPLKLKSSILQDSLCKSENFNTILVFYKLGITFMCFTDAIK